MTVSLNHTRIAFIPLLVLGMAHSQPTIYSSIAFVIAALVVGAVVMVRAMVHKWPIVQEFFEVLETAVTKLSPWPHSFPAIEVERISLNWFKPKNPVTEIAIFFMTLKTLSGHSKCG